MHPIERPIGTSHLSHVNGTKSFRLLAVWDHNDRSDGLNKRPGPLLRALNDSVEFCKSALESLHGIVSDFAWNQAKCRNVGIGTFGRNVALSFRTQGVFESNQRDTRWIST